MKTSSAFTMRCQRMLVLVLLSIALGTSISRSLAQEAVRPGVTIVSDVAYKSGDKLSDYEKERCRLDVYLPAGKKNFPTVVWFHGGGLTEGSKGSTSKPWLGHSLAEAGIAVVSPNYRLSPKATYPAYIEDAAAAVAWTTKHIAAHGGDPNAIFIGGHSAGGYLALMVALDAHYLGDLGVELSAIAGVIPVSGQTMTHYTVRQERGIGRFTITADQAAPVYHARKDTPPMLVLYADRDMAARAAENEYLVEIMKGAGNKVVTGLLVRDRDHGTIASKLVNADDPARLAVLEFIAKQTDLRRAKP